MADSIPVVARMHTKITWSINLTNNNKMYSKNIFFSLGFLFALLASCLHAETAKAQDESSPFTFYLMDDGFYIYGCNVNHGHVDIPDSLTDENGKKYAVVGIKNIAFKNSEISSVRLPKHLVEIQGYAFEGCKNLKTIEFPSSLKEIGDMAFFGSGLTHVTVPGNVQSVGESCFEHCDSLKSVDVDSRLVRNCAFCDNKSLRTVRFGEHVQNLFYRAFYKCPSLTSVVLPANIAYINTEAFASCTGLKSAEVKCTDPHLGEDIFSDCPKLVKVSMASKVSNSAKLSANTPFARNQYAGSWVLSYVRNNTPKGTVKINIKLNRDGSYTATSLYKGTFTVKYRDGSSGPGSLAVGGTFSGSWDLTSDGGIKMSNGRNQMTTDIYKEGNRQVRSSVTSGIFSFMERQLHKPFSPDGKGKYKNDEGSLLQRVATGSKPAAAGRRPVGKR